MPDVNPHQPEDNLETVFPHIRWRAPLVLKNLDANSQAVTGLACRFCIAMNGIKSTEIGSLPQNFGAFQKHMREVHGRKARNRWAAMFSVFLT